MSRNKQDIIFLQSFLHLCGWSPAVNPSLNMLALFTHVARHHLRTVTSCISQQATLDVPAWSSATGVQHHTSLSLTLPHLSHNPTLSFLDKWYTIRYFISPSSHIPFVENIFHFQPKSSWVLCTRWTGLLIHKWFGPDGVFISCVHFTFTTLNYTWAV